MSTRTQAGRSGTRLSLRWSAPWIRGFIAFQLARRTRTVMLMVSCGLSPVFGDEPPGSGPLVS